MVKSGAVFAFILLAGGIGLILPGNLFLWVIGMIAVVLGVFVVFFFRDPGRRIEVNPDLLLSPGDGRIMDISSEDVEGCGKSKVVKIFLSIFDVHLQRAPMDGVIEKIETRPGLFKPAYAPDAADLNARNTIVIKNDRLKIKVIQITGLIARRIECWVKENQSVAQGQKIGFIRFGSQVDIVVPENTEIVVKKGESVKAGLTIIGRIK